MTVPDNLVIYNPKNILQSNLDFIFQVVQLYIVLFVSKIICGFIVMVVDAGWMFVSILFRGVLAS